MTETHTTLQSLVESIRGLHSTIDRLSKCFRDDLYAQSAHTFDKHSADDWRINIYGNALVRLRLILENNFRFIETIGLVAVTRYIFELTLWLELIQSNVNYALRYQEQLIEKQKKYYESSLKQLEREVALLKTFGEEESRSTEEAIKKVGALSHPNSEDFSAILAQAWSETDAKAARSFSIYSDQAKTNGYRRQAHLVEVQAIHKVKQLIQELQQELEEFNRYNSSKVAGLLECKKYDKMAEKVKMTAEYEYIYSYTSKLLHCTPVSVSTDHKNLEPEEVIVFLRYIYTKIRDVIDLALKQPECRIRIK
jgi:hypothetical protein